MDRDFLRQRVNFKYDRKVNRAGLEATKIMLDHIIHHDKWRCASSAENPRRWICRSTAKRTKISSPWTSRIGGPIQEQQYTESELRDLLTRLLQELRPALRLVFIMHDDEGQPLEEVAEALQC